MHLDPLKQRNSRRYVNFSPPLALDLEEGGGDGEQAEQDERDGGESGQGDGEGMKRGVLGDGGRDGPAHGDEDEHAEDDAHIPRGFEQPLAEGLVMAAWYRLAETLKINARYDRGCQS
jgi:hypothetical protein